MNSLKPNTIPLPSFDPRLMRKLLLLCCHFARNVAYYRIGYVNENGTGELKQATQLGATINGNMLDIAVLEWCKLFADRNARHSWRRIVRTDEEQSQFLTHLSRNVGVSTNDWKRYLDVMRVYRDKFVAHLDEENVMNIPNLETALRGVFFLYQYMVARTPDGILNMPHRSILPSDLSSYYVECESEARVSYGPQKVAK